MIVYLDVLFGVNVLMDYITLLATARLGGVRAKRSWLLLGATGGGLYTVLAAVQPWLAFLPLRVLAGIGICAVAFGSRHVLVRMCALYMVVAASFAGLAAALGYATGRQLLFGAGYYFAVPFRVLLLTAAVGYAMSGILLRGDALHGPIRHEVERLTICFNGREREVRVLHDTGNGLSEPVSGKPVVVLGQEAAVDLWGEAGGVLLDGTKNAAARLASLPPELARRCGLLPYRAVGIEDGLLLYFRPDSVRRTDGAPLDCVCAVGPTNLGQGVYDGLIGV